MKYLLIEFDGEKYWYELDDEGYANRQIMLDKYQEVHISCLEDCLAEGDVREEDMDGRIIRLSKQEFDTLWENTLKKYVKQWERIKKKYPVGVYVQGEYRYSYPQGSIMRGDDFIAVYKGDAPFRLHQSVRYKVKSYDDVNMWLVVE